MARNQHTFKKGQGGRRHGARNHLTKTVRETVLAVFNEIQDDPKANLHAFAKKYPRDFYQIAARLIPSEIHGNVDKIKVEIVRTKKLSAPDSNALEAAV